MGEGRAAWEKQNPGAVQEELARSLEADWAAFTHTRGLERRPRFILSSLKPIPTNGTDIYSPGRAAARLSYSPRP